MLSCCKRLKSAAYLFFSTSFWQSLPASLLRMFPSLSRAVLPEVGFQLDPSHIAFGCVRFGSEFPVWESPWRRCSLLVFGRPMAPAALSESALLPNHFVSHVLSPPIPLRSDPPHPLQQSSFHSLSNPSPYRVCPGGNRASCSQKRSTHWSISE